MAPGGGKKNGSVVKIPDIKASSLVVFAGGLQSLANIAFLSIASKTYSTDDYSIIPLYFTLQGLLMVFCYQGMDSMINRAMLSDQGSFYKKALKTSIGFAFPVSIVLLFGLIGYGFYTHLSHSFLILGILVIFQLPIVSLEKIECGLLGLNKFKELIVYKLVSSLISISPLIAIFLGLKILWVIGIIVFTRSLITVMSLIYLNNLISQLDTADNNQEAFYIEEAKKMSWLSAFATLLNYVWPLVLFKIDPLSLSVFFNGNKIPEKVKDYSKLFVSVPSQHWLKRGREYFLRKVNEKSLHIFLASLFLSLLLILTAPVYISIIFGDDYKNSILIAQIILVGVPARVLGAILQAREVFHEDNTSFFRKSNYIQSFLNLALAAPMIYLYREVGLAIHSVVIAYISYLISYLRFKYIDRMSKS